MKADLARFPLDNRVAAPRNAALLLSALVAALGASVLAGWALDIAFLKSIQPGAVTMKANTAMGMLLTGVALALLSRGTVGNGVRLFATVVACGGIAMGALTLGESFFGWDLGIDQWSFHEALGAAETTHPGRMSPPAAFCFVLMGIALLLASRPIAMRLRVPGLSALSVTVILVGGLGLLGHLSLALFDVRLWNYAGLAMHTAAGLLLLGCALLAWVRSERGLTWAMDAMTTGGFVVGIVSIVAVAGLSYSFTDQLRQDARSVAHSQEVLKEIQELTASQKDLTLSLGRYLITRDESSLAERARIKTAIQEDTDHIRRLTAGNPQQQNRLDQVERLTAQRVAMSDQIIANFQQQALSTDAPPATRGGVSPLGRDYPKIGQDIDRVLKEMEAEEYALLQQRLAVSDASSTRTFLLMPVGVYLSLTMLLLGLFFLNDGNVERKRVEEVRTRLAAIVEFSDDAIVSKDLDGIVSSWNKGAEKILGYSSAEMVGQSIMRVMPPERAHEELEILDRIRRGEGIEHYETVRQTKDGRHIDVSITVSPINDAAGKLTGASKIARDITERKKAEHRIAYLNRVYAVLSGINTLIVRVRDRDELFREACQIALEKGGFRMAWIGMVDRKIMTVVPVASAGVDEELLIAFTERFSRTEGASLGNTRAGRATSEKKVIVTNDLVSDPTVGFRKQYAERGVGSMAMLPLIVSDEGVGVLALYASENEFFHEEELKLLTELAGDIAFAIDNIGKEEKIARLSRVRAVTSSINALIVRVRDRQELFDEVCCVAVEHGGFGMAWIGTFDSATLTVSRVAWAGAGAQRAIPTANTWQIDVANGMGVGTRAIREKRPMFENDIATGSTASNARRLEAIQEGFHSIIALPFIVEGAVVGQFSLYSKDTNFFTEDEVHLLAELAGNISFTLEHIDRQEKLEKLSRIRAVSGEINAAIVRIRERDALLQEVCRIVVEVGKFDLVWIGALDQKAEKARPIAWAGFPPEVANPVGWKALTGAHTTLAESLRTRKIAVRNDLTVEVAVGVLREEAVRQGCRSAVCLPLMVDDNVEAGILLYAPGVNFFDHDELALLNEVAADISLALQSIARREQLDYLAYHDALTGLANRSLFHNRLSHSLHARGGEQPLIATVLLDLERFRRVNETLGRDSGDELLRDVGSRLHRANDTASRFGGDLYGLILRGARTAAEVNRALEAIVAACFTEPFALGGEELRVACRAGIALYPGDGADADALLRNAEAALRRSKGTHDRIVFYAPEMNARVAEALAVETKLRRAIERREFVLHYQPKVALASGRIIGAEALIRWQDPDKGLIPPGLFIPVLEETGMIVEVGRWVVEQVFVDLRAWSARGISVPRVAVNVSAIQLQRKDFVAGMIEEIRRGGDCPEWLELEITESLVMRNVEDSIRKLSTLRGMGVTIAIDDFGTGYSSLSYLSRLPLDSLKIDQSFVSGMTSGGEAATIVSTIIALAHGLKLKVVAEGVETAEQSNTLKQLGCDEAQGYLFSKPLPVEHLTKMLEERAEK